jgi:hypothetical protein
MRLGGYAEQAVSGLGCRLLGEAERVSLRGREERRGDSYGVRVAIFTTDG